MQHGKANALDIEFCQALTAHFSDLRDSDAKAIVLTGQGRIGLTELLVGVSRAG